MSKNFHNLHEAYLSVYDNQGDDIEEAYVPMTGKPLKRAMTKVRDLASRAEILRRDPSCLAAAARSGQSAGDVRKTANNLEDRCDTIISRISAHDPAAAMAREAENRRTISVRATPINNRRLKEKVDLYDIVLDYLLDEGYCESVENAEATMAHMSDEWLDEIIEAFNPSDYQE